MNRRSFLTAPVALLLPVKAPAEIPGFAMIGEHGAELVTAPNTLRIVVNVLPAATSLAIAAAALKASADAFLENNVIPIVLAKDGP